MKKFCIILIGVIINFNVFATTFIDGKDYICLQKPIVNQPQVLEFFSFSCQHCYEFENNLSNYQIPNHIKLVKYNVDFLLNDNIDLTHAWAVAIALGIENKVIKPIFSAIQKNNQITNKEIKNIFIKLLRISSEKFQKLWDSFSVKVLVIKQKQAVIDFNVTNVPAVFINGKYMINISDLDLDIHSQNNTNNYFDIISFLIKK
ncbi:DsbA family protein [Candidatus Pantoea edessiphila]|uniref:Thiol:disulfide interchange protein n=1 Tax=Candidatus Pantoea edessiphila TaxID=2044610 RepID=A0A2P5SVT3_9GAMM|nr:DsbA family protein [Candidatus Pantoea edessiphila]PPI86426.1 protein disulfide oxidoreductase DsbA [Candidatus Pantoea edessiphila]